MQNNTFSGLFVGQNIVRLKVVNSTNTFLKEALSNFAPLPEGTVIMADVQTAGRGQMHTNWVSEPGKNLTISILLKPAFLQLHDQFAMNKVVSLAITDVLLRHTGSSTKIKWPNDCLIGGKKIGGVLIENSITNSRIKDCIIGIGLNVNQINFPHWLEHATSLRKILHTDYDLTTLLGELCSALEARYLQLKANKTALINADYLDRLYGLNEIKRFKTGNVVQNGKITGVTAAGRLIITFKDQEQTFGFKEIEMMQ